MSKVVCIARLTGARGKAFAAAANGALNVELVDLDRLATEMPALTGSASEATCLVIEPSPAAAALLSQFSKLRLVQLLTCSQGDIDVIGLQRAGVQVANVAEPLADIVAEYTMGLVSRSLRVNESLTARTVGVVGLGRVGLRVARLAGAAGAQVIFADIRTPPQALTLNSVLRRATLDQLLTTSDVTTLHVPYGPTTKGLIAARELRLMPDGAVLMNMSDRRVLHETAALATAALVDDKRAAGLLAAATQEAASDSPEAHLAAAEFAVANVVRVLAGAPARSPVEILEAPTAGDPAFWSSRLYPRRTDQTA